MNRGLKLLNDRNQNRVITMIQTRTNEFVMRAYDAEEVATTAAQAAGAASSEGPAVIVGGGLRASVVAPTSIHEGTLRQAAGAVASSEGPTLIAGGGLRASVVAPTSILEGTVAVAARAAAAARSKLREPTLMPIASSWASVTRRNALGEMSSSERNFAAISGIFSGAMPVVGSHLSSHRESAIDVRLVFSPKTSSVDISSRIAAGPDSHQY